MNLELLFPTPVSFVDLGRSLTKKEMDFISSQEKRSNTGNQSSVNNYILESSELTKLKANLFKCLSEYVFDCLMVDKNLGVRITQSWLNWTSTNQHHHRHTHSNSYVSGVFYVDVNDGIDRITFFNDVHKTIKPNLTEYTRWNSESWWLPVKTGQVVCFPSHLSHMVETVGEGKDRISLAFNCFLTGKIGVNDELTELIL